MGGRYRVNAKNAVSLLEKPLDDGARAADKAERQKAKSLQRDDSYAKIGAAQLSAKANRKWSSDLRPKEWSLLNWRMEKEINDPAHALDEATQWTYADEKGVRVFALYGIGDGTEATPLYASGGRTAETDYQTFIKFGEEIDFGTDRSTEVLNQWFEEKRRSKRCNNGSYVYPEGRRPANRHAGISSGKGKGNGRGSNRNGAKNRGGVKERFSMSEPVEQQQVNSADPVAYDDNGDAVPLSERFNRGNTDIRYDMKGDSMTSALLAVQSIGRKSVNAFTPDDIKKTRPFAEKYWREMGTKSPFFPGVVWRVASK